MKNKRIVIDTNVLLDCFVFAEPSTQVLSEKITQGEVTWIATDAMEVEYLRVLGYPNIERRLALLSTPEREKISSIFSAYAIKCVDLIEVDAPQCKDEDDQIFIDLAVAEQVVLFSKDLEVLKLNGKKGLQAMHPTQFNQIA